MVAKGTIAAIRPRERRVTLGWLALTLLVTRGLGLLGGLWGSAHPRAVYPFQVAPDGLRYVDVPVRLVDLFDRWDAHLYVLIARGGYDHSDVLAAFFPLYPMAMRGVAHLGLTLPAAGLLVSWAALLLSVPLFLWLGRDEREEAFARRAALIFLLYPGGFFLTAIYSESLFLLCALAAFVCTRRRSLVLGMLAATLAAACRPIGVLLAPALIAEVWGDWRQSGLGRRAMLVLPALGPLVGLGAFAAFQAWAYGDALHFEHVQAIWRRHMAPPWSAFLKFQFDPDYYLWAVAAIALLVWAWRRKGRHSYLIFVGLGLLVPLSSGSLQSIPRFLAVLFPLFFWASDALVRRSALAAYAVVCLPLWVYYSARFAMGYAFN
jgi:hypothetical protein